MAVPSSGQLRLRADIALEVDGSATGSNVSLRNLSASANFSAPDNMSEFYGYSAASPATLSAASASGVTNTQVIANCNVTNDGGATITERGFYFGTSTNMTSNPKYSVGGTTGAFSLTRTGLATSTTYRFWAYATNSTGTTYSSRVDVATYPTMNYGTSTFSTGLHYHYFYWNSTGGTMTFSDTLRHPYLGNVSLYNHGSVALGTDYTISQNSRRYAYRSNDWGTNVYANTNWTDSASINYDWWQTAAIGQDFVFQSRWNTDALGSSYGWPKQGTSVYGYGGYGAGYPNNSGIYGYWGVLSRTSGSMAVWQTYVSAEVYRL
jgi:hypothetical protein